MFETIINPKTGRSVTLNGTTGRTILQNYNTRLSRGAANDDKTSDFATIVNPATGKSVSIFGKTGKRILKNYNTAMNNTIGERKSGGFIPQPKKDNVLIMIATHGSRKLDNKLLDMNPRIWKTAIEKVLNIARSPNVNEVCIGFDGDGVEKSLDEWPTPSYLMVKLVAALKKDKIHGLIKVSAMQSQIAPICSPAANYSNNGIEVTFIDSTTNPKPEGAVPFTTIAYQVKNDRQTDYTKKDHFATMIEVDKGAVTKVQGEEGDIDENGNIKTYDLFGGTDEEGNLVGSTAAWSKATSTKRFNKAYLLVVWDRALDPGLKKIKNKWNITRRTYEAALKGTFKLNNNTLNVTPIVVGNVKQLSSGSLYNAQANVILT